MRFEDLTAVTVKGPVLLNVTPCSMFTVFRRNLMVHHQRMCWFMTGQQVLLERRCVSNQSTVAHRTIILPVVLYCCETRSLILREEHRRRVFENMVLKWMFGLERDEGNGENWENYAMRNLMICTAHPILKSRRMKWAQHVARMTERRGAHRVFVGKHG